MSSYFSTGSTACAVGQLATAVCSAQRGVRMRTPQQAHATAHQRVHSQSNQANATAVSRDWAGRWTGKHWWRRGEEYVRACAILRALPGCPHPPPAPPLRAPPPRHSHTRGSCAALCGLPRCDSVPGSLGACGSPHHALEVHATQRCTASCQATLSVSGHSWSRVGLHPRAWYGDKGAGQLGCWGRRVTFRSGN